MVTRIPILALLLCLAELHTARAQASDPVAAGRSRFLAQLTAEATRRAIPAALADAVATVESGYDPAASGASGEVGLMQVLPSTASMLGFHGTSGQLADPATNIEIGVAYLAGAWTATNGRLCDTLMKYRAGYGETVMTWRSIVYCRRARDYLASIGSPLASGPGTELPDIGQAATEAAAGVPTTGSPNRFMSPAEWSRMRHGHRTAADEAAFWQREEAFIHAQNARWSIRRVALNR